MNEEYRDKYKTVIIPMLYRILGKLITCIFVDDTQFDLLVDDLNTVLDFTSLVRKQK